jgi:hypothetical protein
MLKQARLVRRAFRQLSIEQGVGCNRQSILAGQFVTAMKIIFSAMLRFAEMSMSPSSPNVRADKDRLLNSISLQNAVLCADCDVVSDSPHDHCLVCGSRSLFNISRLLGGMLPSQRARLVDPASRTLSLPKLVLRFPETPRVFNSRGRTKNQKDATQLRIFG